MATPLGDGVRRLVVLPYPPPLPWELVLVFTAAALRRDVGCVDRFRNAISDSDCTDVAALGAPTTATTVLGAPIGGTPAGPPLPLSSCSAVAGSMGRAMRRNTP